MSSITPENWIDIPGVGALLGMAVGDALGTTYEFERLDQVPYPTLATGPATDVVGGGPFDLEAGQITDDTQMAVCLARSLVAHDGIDMLDIATRYVAWLQHAFDVGNQTGNALGRIESGESVGAAGRATWHGSGRRAAGNGSLMRAAPIGVFFARALYEDRLDPLVEASVMDSILTHADPRCVLSCAAFNAAIARGVTLERPDPQAQLALAHIAVPIAASRLRELWDDNRDDLAAMDAALLDLQLDLEAARGPTPDVARDGLDLHRTAGFVRVAFRLAFWHLLHTPSWRDAVVDAASRGGDADTNAAIVGALLGARDGISAIPRAWVDRVLAATQRGPADWAEAHHPRHLLALAGHARGR